MTYDYATERPRVFTENGQKMFLQIRDRAKRLTAESGAATLGRIIHGVSGDTWQMIACVDRLIELGELREIKYGDYVSGQNRLFISNLRPDAA
jgi:hypothetical protein